MVELCKEQGISNEDEMKDTIKQIVTDQEMKSFDFLPQLKKVEIVNGTQGMFYPDKFIQFVDAGLYFVWFDCLCFVCFG